MRLAPPFPCLHKISHLTTRPSRFCPTFLQNKRADREERDLEREREERHSIGIRERKEKIKGEREKDKNCEPPIPYHIKVFLNKQYNPKLWKYQIWSSDSIAQRNRRDTEEIL
ncbi:hypothetical protein F0562_021014 [Nyssa sinensis]|uniref:Uncharacterized protein n=1 Tax=Nyssa sinensis TaxID=561372 RepID=A0A5J5BQM0_9ASTE|nr:hypothetical protein F0562_021014 [Nyssa sinensis]